MDIAIESFKVVLGVIVSTTMGFMAGWIKSKMSEQKQERREYEAVKQGLQDLLRDRLIQSYYHYEEKGWAPIYARENFSRMYSSYRALDGNGVMIDINEKFKKIADRRNERR